jgi:prolyl-tRNA synthetase
MLYRVATLFRDEERPRGLMRAREFVALSILSLHANQADLNTYYPNVLDTLIHVLRQCGLDAWSVPTQDGHEFLLPHPAGDEVAFICGACNYRATSDEARFVKLATTPGSAQLSPSLQPSTLQKVATPNCHTIADVAAFLNVPATQTLKTMMYADDEGHVIFAIIRGDLEISSAKLERAVRHTRMPISVQSMLQPAADELIRATGAVPGYASPVGLSDVTVVADDSVQSAVGMVAGANEEGYHLTGVNIPRDLEPTVVADIAQACAGSACPECSGKLEAVNVIELGGCTRMGTELSEAIGVTFLDASGKARPLVVGGYGLGLSRIVAAVLETHHDERGLMWPAAIAPFDVHLVVLGKEPREQAEALYQQLEQAGLSVLYDDRDESPGVKFNDADLIGLPTRVTVSKRNLDKGAVEVKARTSSEAQIVAIENVVAALNK